MLRKHLPHHASTQSRKLSSRDTATIPSIAHIQRQSTLVYIAPPNTVAKKKKKKKKKKNRAWRWLYK
jgi:hypothetical protein